MTESVSLLVGNGWKVVALEAIRFSNFQVDHVEKFSPFDWSLCAV